MLTNATTQRVMTYLFWTALAVTSVLLLIELAPSKGGYPHTDKIIHLLIFLVLSTLGYLAFPKQRTIVILGLAFYGAIAEVLQHLLTVTRKASLMDWAADIAGILLCCLVFYLLKKTSKHLI